MLSIILSNTVMRFMFMLNLHYTILLTELLKFFIYAAVIKEYSKYNKNMLSVICEIKVFFC